MRGPVWVRPRWEVRSVRFPVRQNQGLLCDHRGDHHVLRTPRSVEHRHGGRSRRVTDVHDQRAAGVIRHVRRAALHEDPRRQAFRVQAREDRGRTGPAHVDDTEARLFIRDSAYTDPLLEDRVQRVPEVRLFLTWELGYTQKRIRRAQEAAARR